MKGHHILGGATPYDGVIHGEIVRSCEDTHNGHHLQQKKPPWSHGGFSVEMHRRKAIFPSSRLKQLISSDLLSGEQQSHDGRLLIPFFHGNHVC